jgi:hypothetical protein
MERYDRQQRVQTGLGKLGDLTNNAVTWGPDGKPIVRPDFYQKAHDIANEYSDLHEVTDHARALQNFGAAQMRERREMIVTNKAVYNDLIARMADPNKPTTEQEIYDAGGKEQLDPAHFKAVHDLYSLRNKAWMHDPAMQEKLKAVQGILGVGTVAQGHDNYSIFLSRLMKEFPNIPENERGAALDTSDANSWISKIIGAKPGEGMRPTDAERMNGTLMFKRFGISGPRTTPAVPAVPPRDQLEINKPYNLPGYGWMKWTGTAFIPLTREEATKIGK